MKTHRILILMLVLATATQAAPYRRVKHHKPRHHYYNSYHRPAYYNYMRFAYSPVRYYRPAVVTTVTKTVYPKNLVTVTAEEVTGDIEALHELYLRNLISERDYTGVKKTLLNRIGMSVNPEALEMSVSDIVGQIEILNNMKTDGLITDREYRKQKSKLLDMI